MIAGVCRGSRIAIIISGLEHPRPHAERRYRLSDPAARKSFHNSNCALYFGEESLVRNALEITTGEAAR